LIVSLQAVDRYRNVRCHMADHSRLRVYSFDADSFGMTCCSTSSTDIHRVSFYYIGFFGATFCRFLWYDLLYGKCLQPIDISIDL